MTLYVRIPGLTYSGVRKASPGELVAAVKPLAVEPDYDAAMKPLDKFLHDDPWFPHDRYEECAHIEGELVRRILAAALAGRVVVPTEGEK